MKYLNEQERNFKFFLEFLKDKCPELKAIYVETTRKKNRDQRKILQSIRGQVYGQEKFPELSITINKFMHDRTVL